MMNEVTKTLQNNKITQFILKIDLMPGVTIDFKSVAEALSGDYGSARNELHVNYNVDMNKVEVKKEEFLTFVLGKAPDVSLRLNCFEKSILLSSTKYNDNSIYKGKLHSIVSILKDISPEVSASRIGMRFINTFPCSKPSDIGKYLISTEANCIKEALKREKISRAILVHEFQYGDYQVRVQCGIPNKFYPSVISNYELILDIDVFGLGSQPLERWEESVDEYNHGAYDSFLAYIKPSLLDEMR